MSNPQRPIQTEIGVSPWRDKAQAYINHLKRTIAGWQTAEHDRYKETERQRDQIIELEAENRRLREQRNAAEGVLADVGRMTAIGRKKRDIVDDLAKTKARLTEAERLLSDFVECADEPTMIGGLTESAHAFLTETQRDINITHYDTIEEVAVAVEDEFGGSCGIGAIVDFIRSLQGDPAKTPCPDCGGRGYTYPNKPNEWSELPSEPCTTCHGTGREE